MGEVAAKVIFNDVSEDLEDMLSIVNVCLEKTQKKPSHRRTKANTQIKVNPVPRLWNNRPPNNYSGYWSAMVATKKMPKV